ncbi:hypothetical protein ACF08N_14550 [Streptomyces sp. NPDC015127]|uniref:hypothetical protein n=1 Tax=Streptomyces sp. NPDC015127 TaxID=3364939 RepID=UPI00370253AD
MRLYIDVREGDWVVVRHGYHGEAVARSLGEMIRSSGFAPAGSADDGLGRWRDLDRRTLAATVEISVPDTLRLGEIRQLCRPDATGFLETWIADPATDVRLSPELTVCEAGLEDGDVLVLCIEHPAEGAYSVAPGPNPAELLRRLQLTETSSAPDGGPRLWGVLLYTDADPELAAYVRTHFDDLNALSGPATRVFVIEKHAPGAAARAYWRRHLEPELYRVLSRMRWLQWQPYDPQGAYEIAAMLDLNPALLPCLVLFRVAEGRPLNEGEKIVFRIEDASTHTFRSLFGGIARALGSPPRDTAEVSRLSAYHDGHQSPGVGLWGLLSAYGPDADAAAFARVREAADAIRASLLPAPQPGPGHTHTFNNCRVVVTSGATVSENFYFQGTNTTFINRPVDTVVSDFQNTYESGIGGFELTFLLQTVLSSRDLSDADREEAAGVVHDLARITTDPEPDVPAVRSRLERLRELVAGGADIAQPALGLIASVAGLFGA